jgi:hypothetical protein
VSDVAENLLSPLPCLSGRQVTDSTDRDPTRSTDSHLSAPTEDRDTDMDDQDALAQLRADIYDVFAPGPQRDVARLACAADDRLNLARRSVLPDASLNGRLRAERRNSTSQGCGRSSARIHLRPPHQNRRTQT